MELALSLETLNNVSEIEVIYRRKATCKMSERPVVSTSGNAYEIFNHYWNGDTINLGEEFKVLLLNRSNRVLHLLPISQGGLTGTVADPRLILAAALAKAAVSIVLCHNHPSGSLKPSRADEEITLKIKEAARYFDIKVLDHIILSSEGYFSFADEGLL